MSKIVVYTMLITATAFGFLSGINKKNQENNIAENVYVKVYIYPSSGNIDDEETYVFELLSDGKLKISWKELEENIVLSESDLEQISDYITQIKLNRFDIDSDVMVMDSWSVSAEIGGSSYFSDYFSDYVVARKYSKNINEDLLDLTYLFIDFSPIEVDLHGWS